MPSNDETRADVESESKSAESNLSDDQEQPSHRPPTPSSPSYFDFSSEKQSLIADPSSDPFHADELPQQFAGYKIVQKLGEGGAGIVFRAVPDPAHTPANGDKQVALKMIRPDFVANKKALQRFEKESRLLAEIDSPHVTRHLEFGFHKGHYFIASEFVEGFSLDRLIPRLARAPARDTLRVVADLLKALSAMHSKGVIHRDVKPANIIATFQTSDDLTDDPTDPAAFAIAKLTDFGLARHIDQSQSLAMTRQHATLGTPTYMAPEQHLASESVDARADVYSAGATMYHLLVGEPPFVCKDQLEMAEKHRTETPVPLHLRKKNIGLAINSVIMKAMEKDPNLRYQDASEMLADVQRILAGQPISIRMYPETPDTSQSNVMRYDFTWSLDASPGSLWPLVSDTDRFNRAIGLPAPEFNYDHSGNNLKIFANANFNGIAVRWREHPFQWICEREMSVLREFESGPFEWVTSTVELHPLAEQKTRLIHRFQVKPCGLLGRLLTPFQFNFLTRRSLKKVYARLESLANDQSCRFGCDFPFDSAPKLSRQQRSRLAERIDQLGVAIGDLILADRFAEFLQLVADPIAARIRPLTLPEKLNCSTERSLQVCWSSVEAGLLNLSWDVICPVCRTASDNISSIEQIESHAHCNVCNIEFETDFAQAVEMVFSVHPDIRNVEQKTWCIGGPFHAPHILAQNRLLAGQHVDIGVHLPEGKYEISGPQLHEPHYLDVGQDTSTRRAAFAIGGTENQSRAELGIGDACVKIDNQSQVEILARLSRRAARDDAMTAAMARQHPLFQQLFPDKIHTTEQLVGVSNLHLLAIRFANADSFLDQVGDIQLRHNWQTFQQNFPLEDSQCQIEENDFESMLVSFHQLDRLLDSLEQLIGRRQQDTGIPVDECCFVIQSGEVLKGSSANQPTAFGKTIRTAKKLIRDLPPRHLLIPVEVDQQIAQASDLDTKAKPSQRNLRQQLDRVTPSIEKDTDLRVARFVLGDLNRTKELF